MRCLGLNLLTLTAALALATLVAGEQEKLPSLPAHGYGPAIHISSGILQLAPDTEQPQLLLVPHGYSSISSLVNPWPHFYVDTLTASHLPHSSITPGAAGAAADSIHEPRLAVNDNVDFSQPKLPQPRVVHSHGR